MENTVRMKPLILTILICLLPLTVSAEQLSDKSDENYEIVIGVTTQQDLIEQLGRPMYITTTEEGDDLWVYKWAKVESIEDDSIPEQPANFFIEFDKSGKVSYYEIVIIDRTLTSPTFQKGE
jgi:hypothetical protein